MPMKTITVPTAVYNAVWKIVPAYGRLRTIANNADHADWEYFHEDLLAPLTEAQKREAEGLVAQRETISVKVNEIHVAVVAAYREKNMLAVRLEKQKAELSALDTTEQNSLTMLRLGLCRSHERGVSGEGLENWLRQNAVLDGLVKTLAANTEQRSALTGAIDEATDRIAALEKEIVDGEAGEKSLEAFLEQTKKELQNLCGYEAVHAEVEAKIAETMLKHGLSRARCEQLIKHAARGRLRD